MKLNQEELYVALGLLCRKIEACGASPALTDAVFFADLVRQSIGNQFNPANGFSAEAVRAEIGLPAEAAPVQRSEKMAGTEPPSAIRELTSRAKGFRKDLDDVLQKMKAHRDEITVPGLYIEGVEDKRELVANHVISLRAVEDAVMRQGMVLKCIGATPNPYPNSYKPESPVIEPTADGIKL